jgi:hypothetical protein
MNVQTVTHYLRLKPLTLVPNKAEPMSVIGERHGRY